MNGTNRPDQTYTPIGRRADPFRNGDGVRLRYGHGQVLLVADERLLLVLSETGEVVLMRATPEKHQELGRLQAIQGKTWNHPVIVHGHLFVRNDEEMACYQLRLIESPAAERAQRPAAAPR